MGTDKIEQEFEGQQHGSPNTQPSAPLQGQLANLSDVVEAQEGQPAPAVGPNGLPTVSPMPLPQHEAESNEAGEAEHGAGK